MKRIIILFIFFMSAVCVVGQNNPGFSIAVVNDTTYVCRSDVFTFFGNNKGRVTLRASAGTVPTMEFEVSSGISTFVEYANSMPGNAGGGFSLDGQKVVIVTGNGTVGVLETNSAKVIKCETDDIGGSPGNAKIVISMSLDAFKASRDNFDGLSKAEVAGRVRNGIMSSMSIELANGIMIMPRIGGQVELRLLFRNMFKDIVAKVPEAFGEKSVTMVAQEDKDRWSNHLMAALGIKRIPKVDSKVEETFGKKKFVSESEDVIIHTGDGMHIEGSFSLNCMSDSEPELLLTWGIVGCPQLKAFFDELSDGWKAGFSNQSLSIEMSNGEFLTTDKAVFMLFNNGEVKADNGDTLKNVVMFNFKVRLDELSTNGTEVAEMSDDETLSYVRKLLSEENWRSITIGGVRLPFDGVSTSGMYEKMFAGLDSMMPDRQKPQAAAGQSVVQHEVRKIEPIFSSEVDGMIHTCGTPVVKYYAEDGAANFCKISLLRYESISGLILNIYLGTADKDIAKMVKSMNEQDGSIVQSDGHRVMLTLETGEQLTAKDMSLSGSTFSGGYYALICNLPLDMFTSDRGKLKNMTSAQRSDYVVDVLSVSDISSISVDKKTIQFDFFDTSELLKKMFVEIR